MQVNRKIQRGFTLIEMIMVIVITGIIGGMVAIFIRAPVQGYVDSARRAEMVDIADMALRRIGRDLRLAVSNSVRSQSPAGSSYIEFLPTKAGGRYRAAIAAASGVVQCGGTLAQDVLDFSPTVDTCFDIVGPPITFAAGDQIVLGNTNWSGDFPYLLSTDPNSNRRAYAGALGAGVQKVVMTPTVPLPLYAQLITQRFQVVPGDQQAVTYACENVGTNTNGDGTGALTRYWGYGFNPIQVTVFPLAGRHAVLANNISSCNIVMDPGRGYSRMGLVAITLGITRGGESINLYHEVHVDNTP